MPHSEPAHTTDFRTRRESPGKEKISKEAINALPLFHYTGKITLVRDEKDLAQAMRKLAAGSGTRVLGFDTETRPSFQKGKTYTPSLVQLADEDEVFLFHLKWMPLSAELVCLLEDPDIVKTGVAVHDDMRFLARLRPFTPRAVIDLSDVARGNRVENRGLRGLAAAFLGLRISKGEQCSNWGSIELSARQIRYAATDAWISRAIYFGMREAGLDFTMPPPSQRKSRKEGPEHPRRRVRRAFKPKQ